MATAVPPSPFQLECTTHGRQVVTLPPCAMRFCNDKSTNFPADLFDIGREACMCMKCLEVVDLSHTRLQCIGNSAFAMCESLSTVLVPDTLHTMGERCFIVCIALSSIDLRHTQVKTIPRGAFRSCRSLSTVVLPQCIEAIETAAFEMCVDLEDIAFPDSLRYIHDRAFNECLSLRAASLSTQVVHIGRDAFARTCIETAHLPCNDSSAAFRMCAALRSVTFGPLVTAVPADAFAFCSSLSCADLPPGVTHIGPRAFAHCKALRRVCHPPTVVKIGVGAYAYSSVERFTTSASVFGAGCMTGTRSLRVVHLLHAGVCTRDDSNDGRYYNTVNDIRMWNKLEHVPEPFARSGNAFRTLPIHVQTITAPHVRKHLLPFTLNLSHQIVRPAKPLHREHIAAATMRLCTAPVQRAVLAVCMCASRLRDLHAASLPFELYLHMLSFCRFDDF